MKKIFLVAGREFIATVSTKAFIIGLLITWYLFVNVRRLAAEAQAKPAVAVT